MASAYPGGLDTFAINKADGTATPTDHPTHHNNLADAVNKIEAELGVNPSGAAATVAAAIAAASVPPFLMYPFAHVSGETPHAADDFFATYSGYTEQTPTGSATWAAGRGGLTVAWNSIGADDMGITVKTVPAAGVPITIETGFVAALQNANNSGLGLVFSDGTGAAANVAAFGYVGAASNAATALYRFTGTLASFSSTLLATAQQIIGSPQFIRLIWKSANTFAWAVSADGALWTDYSFVDFARTITPTHMGFFVISNTLTTRQTALFHYLRVYEADLSL